jgi:Zn-dependent protease with chaperone function
MNSTKFDRLIADLSNYARSHPQEYKWRVAMLAAVGYAYYLVLFAGTIGLLVFLQAIARNYTALTSKDLYTFAGIIVLVLLAMTGLNFSAREGTYVTRSQAPKLFNKIDELTEKLTTVKFHHVIANYEVNAGVLQLPRIGLLGWETNYLYVGLPLMQALSPEQFSAVLAHEFAHLSTHDSRFSNWIYRLRYRWLHVPQSILLQPLQKWYVPFFEAYSFVLARANEYEADRLAGAIVGKSAKAHALIQLHLTDALLRQYFWKDLREQVRSQSEPPAQVVSQQLEVIQKNSSPREALAWLALSLTHNTNNEDTHPCLRERIAALGCEPTVPESSAISAAHYFLGDELPAIAAKLDTEWQKDHRNWCKSLYLRSQQEKTHLEALAEKAKQQPLSPSELWQQIKSTVNLQDRKSAIPYLRSFLARNSEHIDAKYRLGEILLELNDIDGITDLETVMELAPIYTASCCERIYLFWQKRGETAKAQPYLERLTEFRGGTHPEGNRCQKAYVERHKIEAGNKFLPYQLPKSEISELTLQLARYPEIQIAYLVRKDVTDFPQRPLYVLAIVRRFTGSRDDDFYRYDHLSEILLDELSLSQTCEWVAVIFSGANDKLEREICKIKSAKIYQYHR